MGLLPKQFEGNSILIPGIYSKSTYPPQAGSARALTNVVCVIGKARGGVPYNAAVDDADKVNRITAVAEALDLLIDGDGYYATEFYLTPTKDENLGKPAEVMFLRVDPALQASGTLKKVADDIIDIKSARYGSIANQICRQMVAGTTLGKKITVKFRGNIVGERDDIGYECFEIQYTGAGTAAAMTINATSIATTITGAAGDNLSIAFADFPNIEAVVAYIDQHPSYTCTLKGRNDFRCDNLDAVSAQDILTAPYVAKAIVQAIIDFFNNECSGEVIASLHAGADRVIPDNDTVFVFLTSGSDGTASSTDWANALLLLERFKVNHVICASGDPAHQAMVDAHVVKMSDVTTKGNRSAGGGSALATTTKAARIAEAKALNSARFEYCVTPFWRYDVVNGNEKRKFAPYLMAAMVAGIKYANDPTTTATMRTLNVLGLAEDYNVPTLNDYIANGCTAARQGENGFEIVHNVSTYQGNNLILNLPSVLRTCDAITLDLQLKVKTLISGLTRAPSTLEIKGIQNQIITNFLPKYRDEYGWLRDNIAGGVKAFSDVEFRIEGDAFYLKFTGNVATPLHYGFILQKFVVEG